MNKKSKEYEPIIAKGKKKEFLKDSIYEIGENLFDFILDRWKEILSVLVLALSSVLIISLILSRSKQKKLEDFINFERATTITALSNDINQIQSAFGLIQDKSDYIPRIYKSWMLSKSGKNQEAIDELSKILDDEKSSPDIKKIAGIMKINITEDCKETVETYEKIKSLFMSIDPTKKEEKKGYISTIPLITYFKLAKCSVDRPDIIQKIKTELDTMYLVEQFLSQERAKKILIAKQVINQIISEKKTEN